jgi:hypothetical protein
MIIILFSILPYQSWVGLASQIFGAIRLVLTLLGLAALLYWLSRRNPVEALLMAMPVIILYWFPVMEFIPNSIRFWLTFWLFLLPGLTATLINRLNHIRSAVWLVLGASLLIGLPIAYARIYWNNLPAENSSAPSLGEMMELFAVPWLTSAALVLGPILGWGLWSLGKVHGQVGRLGAVITVFGIALNLLGHWSYWWLFSRQGFFNALQPSAFLRPTLVGSSVMVGAGLAAMLGGTIALALLTWKQNKWLSVALVPATLALPLVAMFAVYFGNHVTPVGFSFELAGLEAVYRYTILLIGVGWLVLNGWMTTRLYNISPNIEQTT